MSGSEVGDAQRPPTTTDGPEFLRSLYEHAAVGVEHVGPDGRLLMANAALCRMLGYSQSELLGKTFDDIVPPGDRPREAKLLGKVLAGQYRHFDSEKRLLHRSGTPVWAAVSSFAVTQGASAPYCMSIVRNITQYKVAKAQFGFVVESAPTAMMLVGEDGSVLLANAHVEDLFGYRVGELLQQPVEILVPEAFRRNHSGLRNHFFLHPEQRTMGRARELAARHKDGTEVPVEISLHAVCFENHKWVLASIVNISERKKAEIALCESEDRLRLLLDSTAEGIFGIDLEARCTFCNPSALRVLGYQSAGELLGRNMHTLMHHTRPDGTPYPPEDCPILNALHGGQGAHVQDEVLWRADGTSFHAEYWSNPQHKGEQVVGAVVAFIDITHRDRARRALEKSEEKFAKAFHESPMAITLTSAKDHRYLDVNETFERITGYTREEVIGRTPFDIGIWVNPDHRVELVNRLLAEGHIRDVEVRFRKKDASLGDGLGSMELIEIDGEQFILSATMDITERKRTLQELQESEEKFRTIFRDAPAGMAMVSPDGRYLAVNRAFCDFLGYTEEELLRTDLVSVTHPEDREASLRRLNSLMNQPDSQRIEKRFLHKNGQVRWGDLQRSLIRDSEGNPAFMVSQVVDVTERKRVEQELRQRESELQEAQRLAQVGSWTRDPETDVLRWSEEMYHIHGRDPGLPPPSFDELAQLFAPASWERLRQAREEWKTGNISNLDLEVVRPDGSKRWVSSRGEVERDASGRIVRLRGTAQDVTERKRMERELREREWELREAQRVAQVGSWTESPETETVTWSDEMYRILGRDHSLPAPSFSQLAQFLTADSWERLKASREEGLRTGDVAPIDLELIGQDGNKRWICVRGEAERDASGRVVRFRGTAQDITERKRIDQELRQRESELREAQRVAQVGSWAIEPDTGRQTWSDELYTIFGRDPSSEPPTFDEMAELFTAESWEQLLTAKRIGHVSSLDLELVRPDGTTRWIFSRGEVERDASGQIVRLRGIAQDITERRKAEDALRETELRFRTIANSAPVMVWMSGTDKLCTYFNKRWLEFTGRSVETELGYGWTEGVHPDDLPRCMESYTQSFDRREAFRLEYRLRRHDGEYRWIVDIGVPRFEADGSFAGYIGSCVDDTERREGVEALRTVGGRLIQAQERERKRIARELHDDISQRLAMLAVELQQLKDTPRLSAGQRHARIDKLFKHLTHLTSEVQSLSHTLHSASLEYLGLVPAIRGFCAELNRQQKVQIDFVHSGVPSSLSADVALALFRVTQEALHNAVKYSGVRKFEVRLLGTAGQLQLTVCDSGVGFGPEAAMDGHGLGLISMRERILPLKGTISIVSKPKHGTEITVRVPVEKSS